MIRDPFRLFGWVAIAIILAVFLIAASQQLSFGCINLGFWKSCGISVAR